MRGGELSLYLTLLYSDCNMFLNIIRFRNREKANCRPVKDDWQEVPSTVKEIMRLKKEAKTMPARRRKKKIHLGLFV